MPVLAFGAALYEEHAKKKITCWMPVLALALHSMKSMPRVRANSMPSARVTSRFDLSILLPTDIHMYVCMYVCIHMHMYVCMYVCIHMHMYVCMHVCMYVCMYVCIHMYVYVCIYI
jgi:hypothetical protein